MSGDRFVLSQGVMNKFRASGARSTLPMQLSSAIAQPDLPTILVVHDTTVLEYSIEVVRDGPAGYWRMGEAENMLGLLPVTDGLVANYLGYVIGAVAPVRWQIPGAIYAAVAARSDFAFGIDSMGGGTITYFPLAGLESFFPSNFTFAEDDDFAWEFWIRTTQNPGGAVLVVEQESAGVFPFRIELMPGGALRCSRSDGVNTPTLTSGQAVNDGDWHYVVYCKTSSTLDVQVDDNPAVTTTDTVTGDTSLTVDGVLAQDGFVGDVDELAIYHSSLSPVTRTRHMNAGLGVPV